MKMKETQSPQKEEDEAHIIIIDNKFNELLNYKKIKIKYNY